MITDKNPRGAGRKVGYRKDPEISKTKSVTFKVTEDELARLKRKAEQSGMKLSAYILSRCL